MGLAEHLSARLRGGEPTGPPPTPVTDARAEPERVPAAPRHAAAGRSGSDPVGEVRARVRRSVAEILGPTLYEELGAADDLERKVRQTLAELLAREETPLAGADRARITQARPRPPAGPHQVAGEAGAQPGPDGYVAPGTGRCANGWARRCPADERAGPGAHPVRRRRPAATAARTTVAELRTFVTAVVQAGELGVPIAGVLREHSREMRVRRRQRAEELAQKVPIKILFPVMFCVFPALFVVVIGPGALQIMKAFAR
jgi:hypothetical protein